MVQERAMPAQLKVFHAQLQRHETLRTSTISALRNAEAVVCSCDETLGIKEGETWTPGDECYKEAHDWLLKRTYMCAVENLEALMLERFCELDKANMAETWMASSCF